MKSVGHKKLPQISQIHTDSLSLTQVLHKRKIFFKLFGGKENANERKESLLSICWVQLFLCKETTFPRNFQGFREKILGGEKGEKENMRLSELRTAYWILFWFQSLIAFSMEKGYCGNLYSICLFLFSHFIILYLFFPPTH